MGVLIRPWAYLLQRPRLGKAYSFWGGNKFVAVLSCICLHLFCSGADVVVANVYRLEGIGTLSNSASLGVPGEQITISVDLDPDHITYVQVANPVFRYFEPTQTIPITMTGSLSGEFENVDPVNRLLALELTDDPNVVDQVGIDNGTNGVTSVFKSFCETDDCFDGDLGPFTPTALLELFDQAVNDTGNWNTSFVNVFLGGSQDLLLVNDVTWTYRSLFGDGVQSRRIMNTFDVQLAPGSTYSLTEGESTVSIDFDNPREDVLLEFPLDEIPSNAEILSASLELDAASSSGTVEIKVDGYAGDGIAALNDALATTTPLAVDGPFSAISDISIPLDTDFIDDLRLTSSHLGLRLSSIGAGGNLSLFANEAGFGTPAALDIEFRIEGDFDGDLDVDGTDFLAAQRNDPSLIATWQQAYLGAGPLTTSSVVPEPSSVLLVVLPLIGATLKQSPYRDAHDAPARFVTR